MSRISHLGKHSNKGFTLIELLVVVVIIGILAAVALPNLIGQTDKARTTEASATLSGVNTGEEAFFFENKTYVGIGTITAPATFVASTAGSKTLPNGLDLALVGPDTSFQQVLGVKTDEAGLGTRWDFATFGNQTSWQAAANGILAGNSANLAAFMEKGVNGAFIDSDSTVN